MTCGCPQVSATATLSLRERWSHYAPLRYLEYSKDMKYHEVLESQKKLQEAIEATKAAEGESGNVNSIVKLMA